LLETWPFEQLPNTAVISTSRVVTKGAPVLRVTRDRNDGGWQFLDGEPVELSEARIVAFQEIVELDKSILKLAALPLGCCADRESPTDDWVVSLIH
jgi:hypothetical protein